MHYLKAIIGPAAALSQLKNQFASAVICELPQGFALAPITKTLALQMNEHIASRSGEVLHSLHDEVERMDEICVQLSPTGKIGYIETEYWGGRGGQDAKVWLNGESIFACCNGPDDASDWPNSPISQALRLMGVVAAPGKDEFDTLGLGKHRSTEKWAEPQKTP